MRDAIAGFRGDLARLTSAWATTPRDVKVRRAVLVGVIALGLTLTMTRSWLFGQTAGWPLGGFADSRPLALFLVSVLMGAYGATGGTERRLHLLWFTLGVILVFHLEAATVHWFTDQFTGSVTGTRVDLVALAGTAAALASVLALHADVAASALHRDLAARGAAPEDADAARAALTRAGALRAFALAGGVTALGAIVRVAEALVGETEFGAGGASAALVVGVAVLLLVAGPVVVRLNDRRREREDGEATDRAAILKA